MMMMMMMLMILMMLVMMMMMVRVRVRVMVVMPPDDDTGGQRRALAGNRRWPPEAHNQVHPRGLHAILCRVWLIRHFIEQPVGSYFFKTPPFEAISWHHRTVTWLG
eukprot:9716729-Karenia_brevis.AAC.1